MNTCDEYRASVWFYLDDELNGQELEEFRSHLSTCSACQSFLIEQQQFMRVVRSARPLYSAPQSLRERVAQTIVEQNTARAHAPERLRTRVSQILSRPFSGRPVFQWKPLATAALLALCALFFTLSMARQARANAFVETAAAIHRSYSDGTLPLEIHADSPAAVTAWFAGKVPFRFRLPASQQVQTGDQLYRLTGGRLVNYNGGYAALVTYQMKRENISLVVASSNSAISRGGDQVRSGTLTFHYHSLPNVKVITWSNNGLTYALVSSLRVSARQSCMVCHRNMSDQQNFMPQRKQAAVLPRLLPTLN